jgi:hypothetical protein
MSGTLSSQSGIIKAGSAVGSASKIVEKSPVENAFDSVRKGFERILNGAKSIPGDFMEAERLKKLKKVRGLKALSFSEFKFLDQTKQDFGKLIRLAITFPFSPEFFFYSYIVFPMMAPTNPWAWNSWPAGFDSDPVDMERRKSTLEKRRLQAAMSTIVALNGDSADELDEKKKAARSEQLSLIEQALKCSKLRDAVAAVQPFLFTKMSGKPNALELVLEDVPGSIVKSCCKSIGVEGVPNVPVVRRLNIGEVSRYMEKVRKQILTHLF